MTHDAVLPSLSGPGAKIFLALTIQRNGGPPTVPVHVSLQRLADCTGLAPTVVGRGTSELSRLGLIAKDDDETYRLLQSPTPWLPRANGASSNGHDLGRDSTADVIGLVVTGLRIVGPSSATLTSRYGLAIRSAVSARVREGFTKNDLLAVLEWAKKKRAGGDRFAPLSNLLYLWGKLLPAHLAAAAADEQAPDALTFRHGDARAQFDEDARVAASRPLPVLHTG